MRQDGSDADLPTFGARRRLVGIALFFLPSGCGPGQSGEGTTSGGSEATSASTSTPDQTSETTMVGGSSSTSGDSSSSSTVATAAEGSGSTTSPGPVDCEARNPEFGCTAIDCSNPPIEGSGCGDHHVFDLEGCMRAWCEVDDSECEPDEVCYRPTDCNPRLDEDGDGCYPNELANCSPDENQFDCACTPLECTLYGWCIPAAARPC
jgi:hypothetical protein